MTLSLVPLGPSQPPTSLPLAAFLVTNMTVSPDGCSQPAHQLPNSTLRKGARGTRPSRAHTLPSGPQSSSPDPGMPPPQSPQAPPPAPAQAPSLVCPPEGQVTPLGCTPWTGWAAEERAVCRAPWAEPGRELGVSPRVQGPGDEAQTPGQKEGRRAPRGQ